MDIKLPKLGEGAESGTVVGILVQEGDQVEKGQTIVELENEKAVAPIPATASGVVSKIKVKEGDQLSVGQVIMTISQGGESGQDGDKKESSDQETSAKDRDSEETGESDEEEPSSSQEEPSEDDEEEVAADDESEGFSRPGKSEPAAAPSVRKLARQLGMDLTRVRGSERGGRIVFSDLKKHIQKLQKIAFGSGKKASSATGKAAARPKAPQVDFSKWGSINKKSLSSIRQTISRRMSENWNAIPHVTQFDAADITDLMKLRKEFSGAYEKKEAKLTLTPFILKAVADTLAKHPVFKSSLDEEAGEMILKEYTHIGLAVDTEQGLLVPVIRDVDKKSLLELSREVNAMAEKARGRKVSMEEMQGGTFTISNQGGIGGAHFTPIINRPEVAILGLGRAAMQAVVRDGKVEPRLMMPLTLSYDHRLIDGGSAARFTVDLLEALQGFKKEDVKLSESA